MELFCSCGILCYLIGSEIALEVVAVRVRQTYWSPIGWLDKLTTIYLPWDSLALVGAAAIIGWGNKLFSILLLVVKSLSCGTTLILLFSWLNNYLDYLSIGPNSVSFILAICTVKDWANLWTVQACPYHAGSKGDTQSTIKLRNVQIKRDFKAHNFQKATKLISTICQPLITIKSRLISTWFPQSPPWGVCWQH